MKKLTLLLSSLLTFSTLLMSAQLSQQVKNNSLIVYNSNIGLVHESRDLTLQKDDSSIKYEGVARSIDTDSVSVTLDPSITLYSQQFRFDKLTQSKLLEAHIGKKVEVRLLKNRNEFKVISGTLLAYNGKNSIIRTTDYKIITVESSDIIFDTIPKELITKPSLVWNINASKNIKTEMELDYLIKNISFKSDYILNIDSANSSLTGWITINNRSGKNFKETKLSLLAGDINRVRNRPAAYKEVRVLSMMSDDNEVTHKAYEGYHFYSIPFKVTLANNEKTQLKFITRTGLKIKRSYASMLTNPLYLRGEKKADVAQFVSLEGLNTPLPKGTIRTYSKLNGQKILLGENSIEHTPKNTPLKLQIGKNFDLKTTQRVIKRSGSKNWFNVDIEYTVQNSSNKSKTVELLIPFNRKSTSKIDTKQKYSFTKGNLATFSITVEADSTKSFKVNFESKK